MAYTGTYLYRSTDAGAPPLRGAVGRLTDLFQQVFVDGYNSGSATVSQTGGIATLARASHGFLAGQIIRVTGFSEAGYNIDARVLSVAGDGNSLTYSVNAGTATPGTGSGSVKMCPLDWTLYSPNSATNHKAWQMPSICTNQFWLSVSDNGSGAATYARVRGYETLTANPLTVTLPDTDGTNPFPTNTQVSAGGYIDKSNTADDTNSRAWILISDRKTVHLITNFAGTTTRSVFSFGQFTSYKSTADSYPTYIALNTSSSSGNQSTLLSVSNVSSTNGLYFARAYGGAVGAVGGAKPVFGMATNAGTQPGNTASITYPAPISGGLLMQRMIVAETGTAPVPDPRGHWPGFWFPWHVKPLNVDDTFAGATGSILDGRSFLVVAGALDGQVFFETRIGSYWD